MSSSYDAAIIDTAMIDHPDLIVLPAEVQLLYLRSVVWCRVHRTDGRIPRQMLQWVYPGAPPDAADQLVKSGRFAKDGADHVTIVDFLASQMSKARVDQKRQRDKDRYQRWEDGQVGGKRQRVGSGVVNALATKPDLTRPDLNRKGGEGGSADAAGPEGPSDAASRRINDVAAQKIKALVTLGKDDPDAMLDAAEREVRRLWNIDAPDPSPSRVERLLMGVFGMSAEMAENWVNGDADEDETQRWSGRQRPDEAVRRYHWDEATHDFVPNEGYHYDETTSRFKPTYTPDELAIIEGWSLEGGGKQWKFEGWPQRSYEGDVIEPRLSVAEFDAKWKLDDAARLARFALARAKVS